MEIKIYLIAVGVVWCIVFVTEYISRHLFFSRISMKSPESQPVQKTGDVQTAWRMAAALVYSLMFVQLYTMNFIGTGPTLGFQFGLIVGVLISIPRLLQKRARTPLRWEFELISPFILIAESGFAGILVGWLFQ